MRHNKNKERSIKKTKQNKTKTKNSCHEGLILHGTEGAPINSQAKNNHGNKGNDPSN